MQSDILLEEHILLEHKQGIKRSKSSYKCKLLNFGNTFDSDSKLKEHEHTQHQRSDKSHVFTNEMISLTSSRPRKKPDNVPSDISHDVKTEFSFWRLQFWF